jgi:hypothetical protein
MMKDCFVYEGLTGKKPVKGHENVGLVKWRNRHLVTMAKIVSVIVSTLFPSIAVLVLYFIKSLVVRVGVVLVFSALFLTSLTIFINAKLIEIFAATAA